MRISLLGRNKLGLVDGSCKKEDFPKAVGNHWERVNAIVLSWIMSSVAKGLLGGIMYATNTQAVWEELLHLQKLKLFQFLMGLNDSYAQARRQILLMSLMSSVNQAYSMVISDESQKLVKNVAGILGVNPAVMPGNYEATMFTRNGGGNQNHKFKKNYNL
nr:PREDICTED: uncharacterized protein LOC107770513 [Nicotiana tabacum]